MTYKDAFAIDSVHYNKRDKDTDKDEAKHQLCNYGYYEPKLIEDFYLKYFIYQLLFTTDIMELKDFLEYHYDYCDNPEKYYMLLDLKVVPKIEEIIDTATFNPHGRGYFEEKKLSDGFIETEGIIKKWGYDYPHMLHLTAAKNLQKDLIKRVQIINVFIEAYEDNARVRPLKWIAGPSQLAIIVRELIDKGYMDAEKTRGEINSSRLSRELFNVFSINECDSPKSIEIYLSPSNKRHISAKAVFDKSGFSIPDAKFT